MKNRYAALILGITMGVSLLGGCGKNTAITKDVYGQVTQISENSITIETGSLGDTPSMLDLSGETQTITITDGTIIKRQGMGGGSNDMNMPEGAEPPDMPEDAGQPDMPEGAGQPDMPEGAGQPDMPEGTEPPEKPDGDNSVEETEITLSDISEGDVILVEFSEDASVSEITVLSSGMGMGKRPDGAQAEVPDSYDAVVEYTSDTEEAGKTISSEGTDENAVHVFEGAQAVLDSFTVSRISSDSTGGDSSSFYGIGAAILTTSGTSYIQNSTIDTDAAGGAGIFAYGDGIVYAADTTITAKQDTSGGIHAAGGGTLYAWDLNVETAGESSAAIRSDRGGGTMVVDGGNYTSNGTGSPAIYCTADIAVNNALLTSNSSEAVCIEGLNSLYLFDSDLTGSMPDNSQNDCTWNVILYQSMSGDSKVGNSTFEMSGGSLTAKNGGMFYTTNTESTFVLSDVAITYAENSPFFLRCTGNTNQRGWGTAGSNGADCLFTAINQEMQGDIIWDSISQLDFYMTEGSTLTGAVTDDESYAGNGGDGYCNLYIEKGSSWIVTGDSYLSGLFCAGTVYDASGNTVTVKGNDGTVYVDGNSAYTVTVSSYSESADMSAASSTAAWKDYQVEKPSQLK